MCVSKSWLRSGAPVEAGGTDKKSFCNRYRVGTAVPQPTYGKILLESAMRNFNSKQEREQAQKWGIHAYLQYTAPSCISAGRAIQIIHEIETTFPSLQPAFVNTRYEIGGSIEEF
jgi:hypothetical protein